jgi:hypothetical protein
MDRALCVGSGEIIYGQDIVDLDFFAHEAEKRYALAFVDRGETGNDEE